MTDPTIVTVPWGDYVDQILVHARNVLLVLVPAAAAWGMKNLPGHVTFLLRTKIAEQWLTKAIDYGFSQVDGVVKGQVVKFDVGNEVVSEATQHMVDNAPGWLINWLGGWDGIEKRLLARINISA